MVNHRGTKTIETDRLILRKFKASDSVDMLKNWMSDFNIQSLYMEPVYENEDDIKILLDKYIRAYQENNYYRWAIILKENEECIGEITYFFIDEKNNLAEIGYCIGSKYHSRGFATEATKEVIDFGFNELGLNRIQFSFVPTNKASARVIEKSGAQYEGVYREYFYVDGQYLDRVYYSILKNEFNKCIN